MDSYSFFALLFAVLILVLVLFTFRKHQRQQKEMLQVDAEQEEFQQIALLRVQNPSPKDEQAYTLIEQMRQRVWTSLRLDTSLAPKTIWKMSFDLIKEIAAIYYPGIDNPHYQASLVQLTELNERIILRLQDYLEEFPLNTIKDANVQDVLHYKALFEKVKNFEFVQFARKHKYLYDIGQYVWMGVNAMNPWYWGRKAIFTAGKEGSYRYLLSVILTVVGEEAVLVYSKRQIRTQTVAVEKNIALEMINMAVVDRHVSSEEYQLILSFVLKNPHFDNQVKVALLKALQLKRPLSATLPPEPYTDADKSRLMKKVESVAKADQLSLLKKQEHLKQLEQTLAVTSGLRKKLEPIPVDETHSDDLLAQKRRKEEAILRLFTQAASLDGTLPDAIREYIIQRAVSYPKPFGLQEQAAILQEAVSPSSPDSLTDRISSQTDKERALSEILDALLWYLPFSRVEEEFYSKIVAALNLRKIGDKLLQKRLEGLLPSEKLIDRPPFTILKPLFRFLQQQEQLMALQQSATNYQFITEGKKPVKKTAPYWLCVTDGRVFLLAAATIERTLYYHHLEFQQDLRVEIHKGKVSDSYILYDRQQEIHVAPTLFHSAKLRCALERYLQENARV
ncbi:hypothetical protein CSB45_01230 [candidate division KSB3 bacterium]|uniref:Uncharacterized protein n=1 Tax=candidate division KSB3 bacterium TaxID=2044937 RepID=A0A2G6EAE4_9BACT|nr:MAG: hypothetical protein CSB45_01230 [candidate division KSB3 bacterium]PIE30779.1 MAG: hypothetical protein CSA57_02120 [candidate division KSB3 bacterium]